MSDSCSTTKPDRRRGLFSASRLGIAAGVLFGGLVATGVSWASIPDATGQIHGCYAKAGTTTHALSVIDSAKTAKCPTGDLPLNWNKGALLYQNTQNFVGPFLNGQTDATFTVPAGLMCVQGTATAYSSTTGTPMYILFDSSDDAVYPSVTLGILPNVSNSHMTLAPVPGMGTMTGCNVVPSGTVTYNGYNYDSSNGISDGNDYGSISVQVYSQ
jgi:hypothetical protein